MALHEIRIDRSLPLAAEPEKGHNRWHPDIPPVVRCRPGDEVALETRDALDGQIRPDSSTESIPSLSINVVHPLTGPVFVEGAERGDVLVAEILEVVPADFGYTCQSTGFGFLRDDFPDPFLVKWRLKGGYATSEEVPGVRIPAAPFPGTIGVAPSRDLMAQITERERALAETGGMVDLPSAVEAVPSDERIASEALRTIPPREFAGNVDIKQLTAGTRLLLPVWVDGALLSVGDVHFAQGDSETCGQAIEMTATVRLRLDVRKGEAGAQDLRDLQYERDGPGPEFETPHRYFATTGVCVERQGANRFEDLTLAARNALRNMIDHLSATYGYSRQQAYALCSVAVDLKVSQVVDVPNVLVSALLPLDIFD